MNNRGSEFEEAGRHKWQASKQKGCTPKNLKEMIYGIISIMER